MASVTRAELMRQVAKQTRIIEKMRAELDASKAEQDADDSDADELPDVPMDGLPYRPARAANELAARTRQNVERDTRRFNVPEQSIVIRPTAYVRSLFAKQRRGLGGFQSLHAAIQSKMAGSKELRLNPADYARIVNYAVNYGEGGFQQSLRWLIALSVADSLGIQQKPAVR